MCSQEKNCEEKVIGSLYDLSVFAVFCCVLGLEEAP